MICDTTTKLTNQYSINNHLNEPIISNDLPTVCKTDRQCCRGRPGVWRLELNTIQMRLCSVVCEQFTIERKSYIGSCELSLPLGRTVSSSQAIENILTPLLHN